jgi:AsmA-like C-terminal region
MSPAVSSPVDEKKNAAPRANRHPLRRKLAIASASLCVLLAAFAFAIHHWWPFTKSAVVQDLREAADSEVTVRSFRETHFPFPGCVMEGVSFYHANDKSQPIISIDRLSIRGTYTGILAQHVSKITAEGMHINIPAFGTSQGLQTHRSKITIDEIVANGATLEFARNDSAEKPVRFDIYEATLKDVGWSGPLTYKVKVRNPMPPGDVSAEGKFGVWNENDPGSTPVSGEYRFEHADLNAIGGIGGHLTSTGKFSGKLAHIDIAGDTQTPDFVVDSGGHPVALTTKFDAYVDATNGDTVLHRVDADFLKTHLVAQGSIAKSTHGKGKTALIEFQSSHARIEDLLRLFVKANRAPMSGSITLQAHTELPPGDQPFFKKLKLRGSFGIEGGTFSPATQKSVDELSAGASGKKKPDDDKAKQDKPKEDKSKDKNAKEEDDPETVLSDLKGQVNLSLGNATFTNLTFNVPGAASRLDGTYNLLSTKIDLRGQLQVDSKISNTTTGGKAFMLKMIEPFFKKKREGEIVPVRISGTYAHPQFGLDLKDKKADKVPAP